MKEMCTESDEGREIERTPNAWLQSEFAASSMESRQLCCFWQRAARNSDPIPQQTSETVANDVVRNATAFSIL